MTVTASSITYRYIRDTHGRMWKIPVLNIDVNNRENVIAGAHYEGTLCFTRSGPFWQNVSPYANDETVFLFEGTEIKYRNPGGDPTLQGVGDVTQSFTAPGTVQYSNGTPRYTLSTFVLIRTPNGTTYVGSWGGSGVYNVEELGWILSSSSDLGFYTCPPNEYNREYVNRGKENIARLLYENSTPRVDTDPYAPGGNSDSGGGTGTFSETGDTIGIPGLPALSAVDTGFITLFNPSAAQVKALANYMWSANFDLATFKNIVANPIDCILGLTIVPVNPPNAGSKTVNVGNIPTDVTLPYLSSQYVEVDCGTLNVQEFWGSYLDYSPYTKMSLYLPYIGIVPLDIDDVMNASIAIKYHVDVLSGACVAYVLCNGTQLYTYVGQCSSNVPITSNDFTNTVNGILGIAGSIGKLAADGGASAPTEAAGIAANAINALKPNIQKSGAMSGTGGLMGVQTPYLICQRPRQSVPASQNTYTGYPANITAKLSDLSGYTEIDNIHLDGLSATQEEQQEIMDLLTSGVII